MPMYRGKLLPLQGNLQFPCRLKTAAPLEDFLWFQSLPLQVICFNLAP